MLFLGRFHPLLVHFPIVLLLMAFVFELMSRSHHFRGLKYSVLPLLVLGSCSAVVSALTGYFISGEGGYDQSALTRHQWAGIATAVFSLVASAVKWKMGNQGGLIATALIILTMLVVVTGHLGAGLTHGDDFLTEYAPWGNKNTKEFALPVIANVDEAILYADMIRPVLEHKCYACHSSKRQKGDLRLDGEEFIRRGGENGSILDGRSGELCRRILSPPEDEDHMPPNEREQLSSAETELIAAWVESGASFQTKVASLENAERIKVYWGILQSTQEESWLPTVEVPPGEATAIESLTSVGAMAIAAAHDSHYLVVDFVNAKSLAGVADALISLRDQVVDLSVEGRSLPDSLLAAIGQLRNLRKLSLANSTFEEDNLELSFPELRHLNLTGTGLSDQALTKVADMPKLQKLFLYNTFTTPEALARLAAASPELQIDSGKYTLPVLATDTLIYTRTLPQ